MVLKVSALARVDCMWLLSFTFAIKFSKVMQAQAQALADRIRTYGYGSKESTTINEQTHS